jgi:hypothetical protein
MTPPAARAALEAAIHDQLGDWATEATARILDQLTTDGWDILPATPKETTSHGR